MSNLIIPTQKVWTRQPQRPVKVSGSGLSKDVVFAAVAGQPESISGVLPIPIGTSSFNVTKQGRGLYSPSTTAGGWYWPVSPSHPIYSISTQHTIIVFGRLDTTVSYGCIFGIPYAAAWTAPYYAISIAGSTTETTAAAAASVTTSLNNATIESALVTGQDTSFAVVRDGESGAFYRGGGLLGALTWRNGGAINFSNKQLPTLFNRSSKSTGEGAQGSAVAVLVFKRALSAAEIASICANPWQIFEPEDEVAFASILSGGTSTDLAISGAIHSHSADSLLLSWQDLLTVSDSTHAHIADNLALSTRWLLAVQEALHAHAADNIGLSSTGSASLSVQDSTHAHLADALTLVTTWLLSVADSTHGHAADNLTLDTSNATWLAVQEAFHAHAADNVTMTLNTWLAVAEALHAVYSESVRLGIPGLYVRAPNGPGYRRLMINVTRPKQRNTVRH